MKITHFPETDTLHLEVRDAPVVESRDLDGDTLLEFDAERRLCAITLEHARERGGALSFALKEAAEGRGFLPAQE